MTSPDGGTSTGSSDVSRIRWSELSESIPVIAVRYDLRPRDDTAGDGPIGLSALDAGQ